MQKVVKKVKMKVVKMKVKMKVVKMKVVKKVKMVVKVAKVNKKVKVNKRFSCTNHLLLLLDKLASMDGFQERSRKYEILILDHL